MSIDFRDFNNEAGEEEGVELQENCGADEALISRLSSQPDITQTLAKLTFNIDHLNKQIYQQVRKGWDWDWDWGGARGSMGA